MHGRPSEPNSEAEPARPGQQVQLAESGLPSAGSLVFHCLGLTEDSTASVLSSSTVFVSGPGKEATRKS